MLNIHIGPHKTATTYIQSVLRNSKWKDGFRYYDIYESRRYILPVLRDCEAGKLPEFLRDKNINHILSDENFIGGPQGPLHMYPNAASSLKWAKGNGVNIFFSLRPYHEIFVSSWIESLRFYPHFPFREGPEMRGYPHILAEIEKALNPANMTIWKYSDFRNNSKEIIQLVAGGGVVEWGEHDHEDERISPSRSAITLYEKLASSIDDDKQPHVFNIIRKTPQLKDGTKYIPYNVSDIERLEDRFQRDCNKIAERYDVWKPSAS